ncbi:nitric-oxide reductase large subunit [Pseudovibrio sp. Tun.PSC04-5.I4]|uniref:nitric-oxide reductase large subunit n=1 Tax=Pseudovibrio sp. Tun.PSC04-5.I4 TaxID=1798213 RepID=UPI00087E1EAE|nr:nitric-oxide reductase large subunit [Pseudovibrio sp. Tun.PSC04-5.I4]SDQ22957.1 nitric oxide reductase, NorZ apoprotein [Pseudovibrio sp. Tun.PSC04-5.I4]
MFDKDYDVTFSIKRLWILLGVGMFLSFAVLLYFGAEIYHLKPPIPSMVVSDDGDVIYTREEIEEGQNVWQSLGGMQQGSIWGHGSYVAPDWSTDWLHREALALRDTYHRARLGAAYAPPSEEQKAFLQVLVAEEMRQNRYNPGNETTTISNERASAVARVEQHFTQLFSTYDNIEGQNLRDDYAFPPNILISPEKAHKLSAFFFWTSWSTVTNRPNDTISYTSNWPHEPLVNNKPTGASFIWTIISIMLLLGCAGTLCFYYVRQYDLWREQIVPEGGPAKSNPLVNAHITSSMRATAKYFWVVVALMTAQVALGILTAHYAVEGQDLYGIPLADILPYSISRTWHTQLAVFWIATAWLGTGLFMAPLLSGKDPAFQTFGVNFLWTCLIIIVVGSFAGEWLGVNQFFSRTMNFWFGHQGYEYVDLGRFWQIFLFIGLLLWTILVIRGLYPALEGGHNRSLIALTLLSAVAIGLLYGAGLFWGENTHISIMEYWRWWVVHLWVEGVFEVFATAIIALIFVNLQILRGSTAAVAVIFATIIFMAGGVLGTFHHLYWSGTPIGVLALGAVFSALEVVPLLVVGFEAYQTHKLEQNTSWIGHYKWPLNFFASVLFWNLVGAGLLGFLINPPLALYYMQGLNSTAAHGHAAMFGVYGLLGVGLMLFCLRSLIADDRWSDKWLKHAFWGLNIGLAMMLGLSLIPQGLYQAYISFTESYWLARAPETIHGPLMTALVWARVPGDIVFSWGIFSIIMFMYHAYFGEPIDEKTAKASAVDG